MMKIKTYCNGIDQISFRSKIIVFFDDNTVESFFTDEFDQELLKNILPYNEV